MSIDEPGQQEAAARIDDRHVLHGFPNTDFGDPAVPDQDRGRLGRWLRTGGEIDDPSVPNPEIRGSDRARKSADRQSCGEEGSE